MALPFTDDFNRANGSPGAGYTASVGAATIASNVLTASSTDTVVYDNTNTYPNDQKSQVTLGGLAASTSYAGSAVRCGSGSGYPFFTDGASGAGHSELSNLASGAFSTLKALASTFANGDITRQEVSGDTISLYKNSVFVDSVAGGSAHASGNAGVYVYPGGTVDDFTGAALANAPVLACDFGSFALDGQDAQLTHNLTAYSGHGLVQGSSLSWQGDSYQGAPDATAGAFTLACAQGSFALSGQTIGLRAARRIAAAQGSYALSGQTLAFRLGHGLIAVSGTFSLSGQTAGLRVARRLVLAAGTFSLLGSDATADYAITCGQGSYALNGQAIGLSYSGSSAKVLAASAGSYSLNGQTVGLKLGHSLIGAVGNYSLSGQTVGLRAARRLTAASGAYALTGQDASFPRGRVVIAAPGSYGLSGQAAALRIARRLSALTGSYSLNGQVATLQFGPIVTFVIVFETFDAGSEDRQFDVTSSPSDMPIPAESRSIDCIIRS